MGPSAIRALCKDVCAVKFTSPVAIVPPGHVHTHTHMSHTHSHAHIHTRTHTHPPTHENTHTNIDTHARTHALTHTYTGSVWMLLEYMDMGDLRKYLAKNGASVHIIERLSFCVQVSSGLAYLASKGIVHRDVAARNVLLKSNPKENGKSLARQIDFALP